MDLSSSSNLHSNSSSGPIVDANATLLQIRQMLDHGELRLSFQPILDLQESGLAQYEVRAALAGAESELSTQGAFDIASQAGLGEDIDRWVIGRTVEAFIDQHHTKHCYTVNLTPCSLNSDSFLPWLESAIKNIPATRVLMQVSENSALLAHCQLVRFHRCLANLGIGLSISSFSGTAESFSCLRLFGAGQIKQVKVAPAYFHDLKHKQENRKKLKQLVMQLTNDGIRPVASAIEDMTLLPLLWKLGVAGVQGHCVQAPSPHQDFAFPAGELMSLDG